MIGCVSILLREFFLNGRTFVLILFCVWTVACHKNSQQEEAATSQGSTGCTMGTIPGEVDRQVCYSRLNGMAVFEGDILLGRIDEIEKSSGAPFRKVAFRVDVGRNYRWLNAIVPYAIDPNLRDASRITGAIDHTERHTRIRFVRWTNEPDYISFEQGAQCSSFVGRKLAKQEIFLDTGCTMGQVIHEILHALGFWHTQGRKDRNLFVEILWENIITGMEHNFNQQLFDSDTHLPYDFDSILHYDSKAFSKNQQPTIRPRDGTTRELGQRNKLSDGDVEAIHQVYFSNLDFSPFASWDPEGIGRDIKLSNKNLTADTTDQTMRSDYTRVARANHGKASGKWYWEILVDHVNDWKKGNRQEAIGTATKKLTLWANGEGGEFQGIWNGLPHPVIFDEGCQYGIEGRISCKGGIVSSQDTKRPFGNGDVIGIALDLDNRYIYFAKNGEWIVGDPLRNTEGLKFRRDSQYPEVYPMVNITLGGSFTANFGATPFRYDVVSDFYPGVPKR